LQSTCKKKRYEQNTIRQFINYTAYFFNWKDQSGTGQVQYSDLLAFIGHCSGQGDSPRLINRKLSAVRRYYEYLQQEGVVIKNPASGLFLRGRRTAIPANLLEKEELQRLYENYHAYDLRTARNKVILSLVINQALATGELARLQPAHIRLRSGKLQVPGSRHSNGRILDLEAYQVIGLQEYIRKTRPAILRAIRKKSSRPGRKARNPDLKHLESRLFTSMNGGSCMKNSLKHLTNALKLINPQIKDLKQIRQSVIAHWLKHEDVRTVQYKAGHKHVSTTERYQLTNLEDLQEALNIYHPLK